MHCREGKDLLGFLWAALRVCNGTEPMADTEPALGAGWPQSCGAAFPRDRLAQALPREQGASPREGSEGKPPSNPAMPREPNLAKTAY